MKHENSPQQTLSRRRMFAGAGAAGALAAVAAVVHSASTPEPEVVAQTAADEGTEGYRLTEHVKRYYQTARV